MKGGRGSHGAPTDLLVCFPSRAYLALMPPKPACSPSRPAAAETAKHRRRTSWAGPPASSPLFRARNPGRCIPVEDEPTSPKVTCAGKIKAGPAKPKGPGGKHKKAAWVEALGLKKEAAAFWNALHGALRLNVAGCFGSFPGRTVDYTSEEEEEDDDDEGSAGGQTEHGAALAKWLMLLEEGRKDIKKQEEEQAEEEEKAPPKNALMLMRCRSAPGGGCAPQREEAEEATSAKKTREEEREKERLVLMSYPLDFFKLSVDVAKETWVVGGDDAFLRCRSWKR